MKLTNTWKHATIGSLVGLAGAGNTMAREPDPEYSV